MDGEGAAGGSLTMKSPAGRVPILYLAPWVDLGGADKGTIDWFRFLDRGRFAPSLITTQPSLNRRLADAAAYAEEVWDLPQLMRGDDFPRFIFAFLESRGVKLVHIMNSRLAFELLPVIATRPDRPRIVVQLHVEEPDRSGYVRYVTTRYGNLVDAYSVTSQALSERLGAYDVPRSKRRLIRTGVDARREFSPARVRPIDGLDRGRLQIAFPARLTAQKDPLLMVDVACGLRAAGVAFQIHVLGDGELAEPLRGRIASVGLEDQITMHGDSFEMARWYAACDAVLMTSEFEGLPYVAYEAMAMGVPIVAPRLPGLAELVTPDTGMLVVPPREPEPYARAIATLAGDDTLRRRLGDAARSRVLEQFTLERMGSEHAALYDELLAERRSPCRTHAVSATRGVRTVRSRTAFRGRRPHSRPLVSVVVPCFNHGHYLPECLQSIGWQHYERVETIVADDGSTDPGTLAALEAIERGGMARVVRLPVNRGPGAARTQALEHATGRYVLPLDADNLLLPMAIDVLVDQLNSAGEQIGFIYPNLQFFGNRDDYFEAPSYNLHALLAGNYCDTASLIDREVFDQGLRYSECDGLLHEDWEFALALAEHGIYGEPARGPTLLFRKPGFSRSDLVNLHAGVDDMVPARRPGLFADQGRIKAEWNPSLTVIALDPVSDFGEEAVPNLIAAAFRQTCSDFELIVATAEELAPTDLGPRVRRVPAALASSRARVLTHGLKMARGACVLATYGSPATLLADRAIIEKLLRVFQGDRTLGAIGLADAREEHSPLRLLKPNGVAHAALSAVCWRRTGDGTSLVCDAPPEDMPLEAVARLIGYQSRVQWRHLSRADVHARDVSCRRQEHQADRPLGKAAVHLGEPRHARRRDARFRAAPAMLPDCRPVVATMLGAPGPWLPPQTRVLCRHRHEPTGLFRYSNSPEPAADCTLSHVLGAVRALPLQGTTPISVDPDGTLLIGEPAPFDDPALLGFVEQAPLPMFDGLAIGRDRQTGQPVLVGGPPDPLAGALAEPEPVGFIEPYPIQPQIAPHIEAFYGLAGLVRTADPAARRHRYGAGHVPPGTLAGELGALLRDPADDRDPLWIDEHGSVFAAEQSLSNGRPSLVSALQWAAAPLTWTNFSAPGPKLRASGRRAYESTRLLGSVSVQRERPVEPAGYLLRSPASYTVPLYGALHPVTGDQLLSTRRSEATSLGYRDVVLLGHLIGSAPVTGRLGPIRAVASWTNRFGMLKVAP
ncbi:MAG TPA: glycosyltransferase [Solirubrobacteraceae bacterium]